MFLGNLSLSDNDISAQTSLGCQQIIKAGVSAAFGDVEADGEELVRGIKQKAEVHLRQLGGLPSQGFQSENALAGATAGLPQGMQPLSKACRLLRFPG